MNREFYIDTPIGKLHVWAKHETDSAEDFPGVFIDIVYGNEEVDILTCVEYESVDEAIQTCTYKPGMDEPVSVVRQITKE